MPINTDNTWLSRIAQSAALTSDTKTIAFDGTDGNGAILTKATATLTSDATAPTDGDTVTIDGHVYTFQDTLVDEPDNVLIGANAAAALDNLKLAINAGAGAGTNYGTGTVAHATVTAETNTDTTQVIQAITGGTAGNSIAVSESSTHLTWGSGVTTLSGGLDGTAVELFTATGNSLVAVILLCTEDLAGASATYEVGVAGATAKYIPQTTATNFDAGESADITGIVSPGTALVTTPNQSFLNGQTMILTPATASITNGTIEVITFYRSLSGSSVDRA